MRRPVDTEVPISHREICPRVSLLVVVVSSFLFVLIEPFSSCDMQCCMSFYCTSSRKRKRLLVFGLDWFELVLVVWLLLSFISIYFLFYEKIASELKLFNFKRLQKYKIQPIIYTKCFEWLIRLNIKIAQAAKSWASHKKIIRRFVVDVAAYSHYFCSIMRK